MNKFCRYKWRYIQGMHAVKFEVGANDVHV